jgi:hypothetical protein
MRCKKTACRVVRWVGVVLPRSKSIPLTCQLRLNGTLGTWDVHLLLRDEAATRQQTGDRSQQIAIQISLAPTRYNPGISQPGRSRTLSHGQLKLCLTILSPKLGEHTCCQQQDIAFASCLLKRFARDDIKTGSQLRPRASCTTTVLRVSGGCTSIGMGGSNAVQRFEDMNCNNTFIQLLSMDDHEWAV